MQKTVSVKKVVLKEELKAYEIKAYGGEIRLIEKRDEAINYILSLAEEPLVGFDTETRPTFKKGPLNRISLLQICTATEATLIRINKTGFFHELIPFFESKSVLKVGIGLSDDLRGLRRYHEFTPQAFLDLNELCPKIGFESIGAVKLSALVLGFRLSKRQQTSNWENPRLSPAQELYAATDAWVSREIFLKLYDSGEISQELLHSFLDA